MQLSIITLCAFTIASVIGSPLEPRSYQDTWDEPASIQTTTDEEGNQITKTLWWIPPSSPVRNGPTSSAALDEYSSSNWRQLYTSNAPMTTVLSNDHDRSISTISDSPQPSSSAFPSDVASDLSSSIAIKQESEKANATIPVSNAADKLMNMPYGVGAIALAILLI